MKIPGNQKCHMISYFPSGEMQIKEEICSCNYCYNGNFIMRDDKTTEMKGRIHVIGNDSSDTDVNFLKMKM